MIADRKNLVIIRAGEKTLHRAWLENSTNRSWDLIVSWYGSTEYEPVADERVMLIKGGKWDGLYKTITALPDLLDQYDYFWLPDDDIATDCDTINRVFDLMRQHGLNVGQPSLSWNSYFTYFVTLNVPGLHLRYTNMVEVMVPCLNVKTLRQVLPLFAETMTGFGLDWVWTRLDEKPERKAAIFDCITVHHTRPVGVFLNGIARASGHDPDTELQKMGERFGIRNIRKLGGIAYAAISADGQTEIKSAFKTHFIILKRMWRYVSVGAPRGGKPKSAFKCWRRYAKIPLSRLVAVEVLNLTMLRRLQGAI